MVKKGMHWGIRNYQNYDGSLTPEGRERYRKFIKDTVDARNETYDKYAKKHGLPSRVENSRNEFDNKKAQKGIYSKDESTDILKKGSMISRYTNAAKETVDGRRKYAAVLDEDVYDYGDTARSGGLGFSIDGDVFRDQYSVTKDVKIATAKVVEDELLSLYGNESAKKFVEDATSWVFTKEARDFVKDCSELTIDNLARLVSDVNSIAREFGEKSISAVHIDTRNMSNKAAQDLSMDLKYIDLAQRAVTSWAHKHLASDSSIIDNRLIKKGYDACIDYEDYFTGFAKYPLIFLNPKDSLEFYKQTDAWEE